LGRIFGQSKGPTTSAPSGPSIYTGVDGQFIAVKSSNVKGIRWKPGQAFLRPQPGKEPGFEGTAAQVFRGGGKQFSAGDPHKKGEGYDNPTFFSTSAELAGQDTGGIVGRDTLGILEVEFKTGWVYQYLDVPNRVFNDFLNASSKGRFLWNQIRGKYTYRRIR
jgi:hypothetical protein